MAMFGHKYELRSWVLDIFSNFHDFHKEGMIKLLANNQFLTETSALSAASSYVCAVVLAELGLGQLVK